MRAVEEHRPALLLVSAIMAFHLPGAEQLIALVRSSEAGFDHHLVKPVDLAALQAPLAESSKR